MAVEEFQIGNQTNPTPQCYHYLCAGSYAAQSRQPRQVRKEATVTGQCVRSRFPGT